jgi:acetolactate synthase-1/2/3 large subunit
MNGAECLLRTLLANDVDLCLMNPGTSEMQFVSALDRVPRMRGVLGLFEGVCSGAADGYARMTGKPAATLLHLGPGLANALANLHNARKARSPVVNIVGEHSTQHLRYDAPLTADTAAFARPVSGWVMTVERAAGMGEAASAAVAASLGPPGKVASLIVPADFSWSEAGEPGCPAPRPSRPLPAGERVRAAARALRSGAAGLLLSGSALQLRGLRAAGRVRAASGARVFADRYAARMARGGDIPAVERIPYFPEPAQELLAGFERLVLVEARPPVSFFGYPGLGSSLAPAGCAFDVLASEDQDGAGALECLAEELAAPLSGSAPACPPRPDLPGGEPLSAGAVGRAVGALLPEGAIVSDEAVSSGEQIWPHLAAARRHDHLPVTGGAIGQGLPVAMGAALACPGRKVVALEADGSAMYTLQSLWTMARERLDVTIVILANRRYRILDIEMQRTGAGTVGPRAGEMIDLSRPAPDWIKLAEGFGVQAARAATADEFIREFGAAMREPGPRLIEAVLDPT